MTNPWLIGLVVVGVVTLAVLARLSSKGNATW